MPLCVSKQQVISALVLSGGSYAAAVRLKVSPSTLTRAIRAYSLRLAPRRIVDNEASWERLYEEHGTVMAVARSLAVSHSYVHRKLEEYGIRPMIDPWLRQQESAE